MYKLTKRETARHEIFHGIAAAIGTKLFYPEFLSGANILISVSSAGQGECAILGDIEADDLVHKRVASLMALGPLIDLPTNTVKAVIRKRDFDRPDVLSEADLRLINTDKDVRHPHHNLQVIAGSWAYLKLATMEKIDEVATVLMDSAVSVEMPLSDFCPEARLDRAIKNIQPLLRAVDTNQSWTDLI